MEISRDSTLQECLAHTAKRLGANFAQADSTGANVTYAEALAKAFAEKFGIRPFEAYGCSECSPAVTMNGPNAVRHGSIGKLLPEMELQVVNPSTGHEVAPVGTES